MMSANQPKHRSTTCKKCGSTISFGLNDSKREASGREYVYCQSEIPDQKKKCWTKNYTT